MTDPAGRLRRLLLLGDVVIDVVLNVSSLPERGADVIAGAATTTPGGGFNVMAAAARQGLRVAYAGAHGSGPFAALARSGLAAEGIEVLLPPKPDLDTGIVITMVEADGERTFVTGPGAEARLTAQDLAPVRADPADAVYLSGYGLLHASHRSALLAWLERLGDASVVFFDPGPLAARIPAAALAQVMHRADWLTCNAREAAILATYLAGPGPGGRPTMIPEDLGHGRPPVRRDHDQARLPPTPDPDPPAAARALSARAPRAPRCGGVIVRTGPGGCLLVPGDADPVRIPGFRVNAVDTTGAGDAHTGTFIAALAKGTDPAEAARQANAAAALSVTRRGPATAPTAAELTRFLARRP